MTARTQNARRTARVRKALEEKHAELSLKLDRHLSGEARLSAHERDTTAWALRFTLRQLDAVAL